MIKAICRNVAVKLPNNKNFVYALQNLDTQNIKPKKYEMSESHSSPFLVYTKDNNKFVAPKEKYFKYANEKQLQKKIYTNK